MSEISINVLQNMQLAIHPHIVAADGDHNSATFKITSQPSSLDGFACRAEIQNAAGEKTYRLVDDNGEFLLTNDIAVEGIGYLQLVYGDGVATTRKTNVVAFNVLPSIDAVDQSDPEFSDGLAQLQQAAFCRVDVSAGVVRFYNYGGQEVGQIELPGSVEDLNNLYLRVDGGNAMSNDLRMLPSAGIDAPIGIVVGGRQAQLRWDGALILTRGQANEPVQIENNNGSNRSDIVTVLSGDQRYLREFQADDLYLSKAGGQLSGILITAPGSSLTSPGLGIGDNSTGFYRSGSSLLLSVGGLLYAQWLGSPPSLMMTVPLNMATQGITNVGVPVANGDAANKQYVDTAVAGVPRPAVPASRTFVSNEVTITPSPQVFFDQPFFTNDNTPRTIVVTVQPQYASGTPSAFYDLEYTTNLSVGLFERVAIYPTANAYMGSGTVCFAATVTPVGGQIQVQLSVRQIVGGTNALVQVGSRADQRSYVIIQEMTQ